MDDWEASIAKAIQQTHGIAPKKSTGVAVKIEGKAINTKGESTGVEAAKVVQEPHATENKLAGGTEEEIKQERGLLAEGIQKIVYDEIKADDLINGATSCGQSSKSTPSNTKATIDGIVVKPDPSRLALFIEESKSTASNVSSSSAKSSPVPKTSPVPKSSPVPIAKSSPVSELQEYPCIPDLVNLILDRKDPSQRIAMCTHGCLKAVPTPSFPSPPRYLTSPSSYSSSSSSPPRYLTSPSYSSSSSLIADDSGLDNKYQLENDSKLMERDLLQPAPTSAVQKFTLSSDAVFQKKVTLLTSWNIPVRVMNHPKIVEKLNTALALEAGPTDDIDSLLKLADAGIEKMKKNLYTSADSTSNSTSDSTSTKINPKKRKTSAKNTNTSKIQTRSNSGKNKNSKSNKKHAPAIDVDIEPISNVRDTEYVYTSAARKIASGKVELIIAQVIGSNNSITFSVAKVVKKALNPRGKFEYEVQWMGAPSLDAVWKLEWVGPEGVVRADYQPPNCRPNLQVLDDSCVRYTEVVLVNGCLPASLTKQLYQLLATLAPLPSEDIVD